MKYKVIGLILVTAIGVFGLGGACEDLKEACGPCGTVEAADGAISGDASLDAFFKAVGSLNMNVGKINAGFEGNVRELAAAFEVEGAADMEFDALVDATVAAITAEFNASVEGGIEGGLKIDFQPPKCEVNVDASFSASAQCQAKAGCDVDAECTGGEVSFECSGTCEGKCEGECSLPVCTVALDASLACSGECSGKCTATASGECSGECRGDCSGECSAYNGAGDCNGACDGSCTGECAVEVKGECTAKCEGECKAEFAAEADCQGEPECKGECSGSCSGGCKGEVSAPKCSVQAECEAEADCQAQANASASANASCTPPSLEIKFVLNATLEADASAKAAFMGKVKAFKTNMIGMIQGMENLKILVDADAAAKIGIEPPTVTLAASVDGLIDAAANGDFEIKPALLGCTLDALDETGQIFGDLPGKLTASVEGQAKFYAILF